ncbi:chemotaxis protein CheW [Paraburkholderia sp. SOS3]|jgi:chemotaxis-related protein WspB|uniref:chemotaxis protein CheW n=1 Tax=Paraburkholderia sp. SOS3 TaxID=1926494 RepID=UPI0009473C5E|nr:chemotaxis protein CheW [Paraburkholderia sp. SOS3]APR35144.1 chemotaxis protein CheW [Paraburkholderia sp. SOS3]
MLFLLFNLDGERYALDAAQIVEVLALQPTRPIPGAPAWVAGVAERYGEPLPVIDVPRLALGRDARRLLSTRLVVVKYRASEASSETPHLLLGLIVEGATQTRRLAREQFADTGVATPHARWLGPVANDGQGFVQWVEVRHMLTDDVKALLFPQELTVPHARAQASTS